MQLYRVAAALTRGSYRDAAVAPDHQPWEAADVGVAAACLVSGVPRLRLSLAVPALLAVNIEYQRLLAQLGTSDCWPTPTRALIATPSPAQLALVAASEKGLCPPYFMWQNPIDWVPSFGNWQSLKADRSKTDFCSPFFSHVTVFHGTRF